MAKNEKQITVPELIKRLQIRERTIQHLRKQMEGQAAQLAKGDQALKMVHDLGKTIQENHMHHLAPFIDQIKGRNVGLVEAVQYLLALIDMDSPMKPANPAEAAVEQMQAVQAEIVLTDLLGALMKQRFVKGQAAEVLAWMTRWSNERGVQFHQTVVVRSSEYPDVPESDRKYLPQGNTGEQSTAIVRNLLKEPDNTGKDQEKEGKTGENPASTGQNRFLDMKKLADFNTEE